jgi:hypothetical protein
MAKVTVLDYSTTAASNTDINSIGIQGTNAVSNFDNAFRELMAQIASGISLGYFNSSGYAAKSGNYTVLTTDRGTVFDCTANLTLSLPVAATAGAGFVFSVKANGATVIIDPNGAELIDGAATVTLTTGQCAMVLCSAGTAWKTVFVAAPPGAATTTASGIVELATDAEAQAKADTVRAITPSNLAALAASTTFSGFSEFATSAEYRVGTDTVRSLAVSQVWGAAAEVTLTDAATIAVDFSTFINGVVTLAGNRAMGNPTNEKAGQTGVIRIVQDGTGSRTLSYGTDWEFAGGTAPVLSTAAGSNDLLFYYIIATDRIFANLIKASV